MITPLICPTSQENMQIKQSITLFENDKTELLNIPLHPLTNRPKNEYNCFEWFISTSLKLKSAFQQLQIVL